MMDAFAKYAKYAAFGIAGIVATEIIYHLIQPKKTIENEKDDEILEIIYCRDELTSCCLATGIDFNHEFAAVHPQEMLVNLIMSAQQSIQVAMYIFTNKPVADALIDAHAKGVKVSVIVDHSMENSRGSKLHDLQDHGIQVRVFRDGTMHLKLCLIDIPFGQSVPRAPTPSVFTPIRLPSTGITITGSLNWTNEALLSNEENFIISSNKQLCETSALNFFRIWNASTIMSAPYS